MSSLLIIIHSKIILIISTRHGDVHGKQPRAPQEAPGNSKNQERTKDWRI
jgi:hypothetical protein